MEPPHPLRRRQLRRSQRRADRHRRRRRRRADPGTGWTRVDARRLRTRGGLLFSFRADGSLESLRFATLDYPRIVYAPTALLQCTSSAACAPLFDLENRPDGQPLRVTDARSGRAALFDYDAAGRLSAARSPEDVAEGRSGTRYEYAGGALTATVGPEGQRVEYAYQAGGRIRSVTQRGEGDPTHVFDFYGRNAWGMHRTVHRNPLGGHTHVYFDESRRVLRVERFEAGEETTLAWQGLRPTRIVDPGGATEQLIWQQERLISRTTPAGNRIHIQYAPGALSPLEPGIDAVLRIDDFYGPVESRSYDGAGRPVAIQNGAGETRTLAWDGANLVRSAVGGVAIEFPVFGVHGHWLDALAGGEVVARRAFDAVGNQRVAADLVRAGGVLGVVYDADRRAAALEVAASDDAGDVSDAVEISLPRVSDGGLLAIDRPGDGDHAFVRDALGRVVLVRERSQGVWRDTRIGYDAAGNVTSRELANGMRQEWEYDAYGRVVRHLALRGGVPEGEERFVWQGGRIAARSDSLRGGGEVIVHDAAGRTISIVFGHGESISYAYDARDRLTREVYSIPGVGVVADIGYAYDGADRRVEVRDRESGEAWVRWQHLDGRIAAIETGNGLRRSFAYDERGRLTSLETRNLQGALVEQTSVSFAAASAPARLEIRSVTQTALATTDERYWMPLGNSLASPEQRIGKRVFGWSRGSGTPRRYAWDELGNPAPTSQGDSFGYDAERSRLLSASLPSHGVTLAYGYDAAGFVTSRNGVALGWTALGRLARFGADAIDWDMAGRPIRVTENGVTREFRWFGGRVEGGSGSLGALDLGDVVLDLGGGALRYRHFDFREQVGFVSEDAGAPVAHYRYHPFGVDAGFGPEAGAGRFENRPAFAGFFLLGARVLDPAVGRFLSPDPVLQMGNQYGYAWGNPVSFRDVGGLDAQARADATQAAADLMSASKAVAFLAVLAGGGKPDPTLASIAAGLGLASLGLSFAIDHGFFDGPGPGDLPPPRWDPPGQGRVTIWDPAHFDFSTPSTGCAPLAMTHRGEMRGALLLALLLNAIVAGIWWRREGRRRQCSRT